MPKPAERVSGKTSRGVCFLEKQSHTAGLRVVIILFWVGRLLVRARCLPDVNVTERRPVDGPVWFPRGLWLKFAIAAAGEGEQMTPCWPEGRWLLLVQVELLPKRRELRGPITAEKPETEGTAECSEGPAQQEALGQTCRPCGCPWRWEDTPQGASFLPWFCRRPGATEAGTLPSEEVVLIIV